MKEFKWQKEKIGKYIRYLGVLNIFFTILLSCLGNSNKVYASVYKTGTSDHYSIQVSQLAQGREELIVSWHNVYEGQYYNYVDLVSIACRGANGTTYTFYLCLHDTGEETIKFASTDLSSITIGTVQSWEFADYNTSNIQIIVNRMNSIISSLDSNTNAMINMETYIHTLFTTLSQVPQYQNYERLNLNLYQYMAYAFIQATFPGYMTSATVWGAGDYVFPEVPIFQITASANSYVGYNSISIPPHSKRILVIGSTGNAFTDYVRSYSPYDYSNLDVSNTSKWRRVSSNFYLNAYIFTNNSDEYTYYSLENYSPFPDGQRRVSPLYLGDYDTCEYLPELGLKNTESQQLSNNASTINDLSNQTSGIEETFNNDFNDNLDNIDENLNNNILSSNNFLQSANWVRLRFNSIVNNNPFGDILQFSLIFGIALLLIGRVL